MTLSCLKILSLLVLQQVVITCLQGSPSLGFLTELIRSAPTSKEDFALVTSDGAVALWRDEADYAGVLRVVEDLQADIDRVTGKRPDVLGAEPNAKQIVLIGTLGKSVVIDSLVESGKIAASDLRGKWESYVICTLDNPMKGVDEALVIAGSDKRGTIYGVYELCEQLGVSPWHWWADVPPKERDEAYVTAGYYSSGEPAVRYRGIFLNNEAPALTGWANEKYGTLNSDFYTNVFELLLRLRANYLWPAMWNNAFNEDDPENPRLADEYGIVMGTSHHEPMMRAHKEWTKRNEQYGNGEWNYNTNAEALQRFFREGIARNKDFENLVTIGLRGDGDVGMESAGSMEDDIRQLEQIFTDQRQILEDEMGVDPATVPQLWALFTEVQKFYEHGLRPPDDVTLLWTDDNAGNLRRLPTEEERKRTGGSGIYYHFDMHGGPYAYQWINTFAFPKIWEQMNLALEYEADRIWIVNVGDLKPLELPIEFFLRMASNPDALGRDRLGEYTLRWAERDFGSEHAEEIASVVTRYMKYNSSWRKPGQIQPDTFSQMNYKEADSVEKAWLEVARDAEAIYWELSPEFRDAYYQLVLYPTKASALVNVMNILAGRNHLYAKQGRASTNELADKVRKLFKEEQALSDYYNYELAGGKWKRMMDQDHIGQWGWEPPIVNIMPPVSETLPKASRRYGVSVEGDLNTWPDHYGAARLPTFDSFNPRRSWVDVFAVGSLPFGHSLEPVEDWILVDSKALNETDRRYWVEIDWEKAPRGKTTGSITVTGSQGSVRINVPIVRATSQQESAAEGHFASLSGPIAFDASNVINSVEVDGVAWKELPDYGRVAEGMTVFPVTAESVEPPAASPTLEYPVYVPSEGEYEVTLILGPVMDFVPDRGIRIAVAFDDSPAQVLDIFENRAEQTFLGAGWWNQFTRDNVRYLKSKHMLTEGSHALKVSMVDPGIVVQKIEISNKPVPASYFGPPSQKAVR